MEKLPKTEKQGTENDKKKDGKSEKSDLKSFQIKPKPFWIFVKQKTKRTESIPNLTKQDGELTVSDQEKAEVMSQFFSSIFTREEPEN